MLGAKLGATAKQVGSESVGYEAPNATKVLWWHFCLPSRRRGFDSRWSLQRRHLATVPALRQHPLTTVRGMVAKKTSGPKKATSTGTTDGPSLDVSVKNQSLSRARRAKEDEFYTQLPDIERDLIFSRWKWSDVNATLQSARPKTASQPAGKSFTWM